MPPDLLLWGDGLAAREVVAGWLPGDGSLWWVTDQGALGAPWPVPLADPVEAAAMVRPIEHGSVRLVPMSGARFDPSTRTLHLPSGPVPVVRAAMLLERPGRPAPDAAIVLPSRPRGGLLAGLERHLRGAAGRSSMYRAVVVGGGEEGTTLALALEARLWREGLLTEVRVVSAGTGAWGRTRRGAAARVALAARGIRLHPERRVVQVGRDGVVLDDGVHLPAELVVWATGPAEADPGAWDGSSHAARAVAPDLAVVGYEGVYAAGDGALAPWGEVGDGVRAGRALRAALVGRPKALVRPWCGRVLDLSDGGAMWTWGPLVVRGTLVRQWVQRPWAPPEEDE